MVVKILKMFQVMMVILWDILEQIVATNSSSHRGILNSWFCELTCLHYNIFCVGIDPSLDNAIRHNIGGQLLDNNYIGME